MARLDNIKRILRDDFESKYGDLIDRLAFVLNRFMEQVVREVNGNLDFTNLAEELQSYKVTVNASGVPIGNDLVRSSINNPSGLVVIKASNLTSITTFPTSAPWISFKPSGNLLKIQKITGLQADNEYRLTLRIIP